MITKVSMKSIRVPYRVGSMPADPPFSPTLLSGLLIWTRADMGVTLNKSAVSTWADQSGNGNNLMSLGTNQPTLLPIDTNLGSGSSLVFAGGQKMNSAALTIAQPNTIIVVGRVTTLSGNPGIIDDQTNRQLGYLPGGTTYAMDAGATVSGGVTDTARHAWAWVFNGATSKLYVDSTTAPVLSGNAGAGSGTGGLIIGTQSTGFMTGEIAEVIVYSRALSAAELKKVFAYAGGSRTAYSASPVRSLTFDGNSIVAGYYAAPLSSGFAYLVAANFAGTNFLNDGFSGYTTPQCDAQAAVLGATDSQYSALRPKNVNVMLEGLNDYHAAGSTPAQCITNLATYVTNRHAIGWKVIMCTLLPSNFMTEVDRATINNAIMSGSTGADATADIGSLSTLMGTYSTTVNPTYYFDQTHPTTAGHALIEPIVTAAVTPWM